MGYKIFDHKEVELPDDCFHKISPSCVPKFFSYPSVYCKEEILKLERAFKGNTSTVLGSICHYIYESVTKGNPVDRESINKELYEYALENPDLNLDLDDITINYPLVSKEVVNNYVIPHNNIGGILETEVSGYIHLKNGIYLAGTCDRIEGTTIVDYKNVSKMPSNTSSLTWDQKMQLMSYAKIFRSKGYLIENLRIVYGIKPTAKIPARCIHVEEPITYQLETEYNDALNLIVDSVNMCREYPELTYLIFKSMSLKDVKVLEKIDG